MKRGAPLSLVYSALHNGAQADSKNSIFFHCQKDKNNLNVFFSCDLKKKKLYSDHSLSKKKSAKGLWEFDVVEIFVTASSNKNALPYYEFIVSPEDQFFELEILEPRKKTNENYKSGFLFKSEIQKKETSLLWNVEMKIPLEKIGVDLKKKESEVHLRGNAFAIFGEPHEREYWSLFLPRQENPDFHLPQFFKSFF
jgi:hypothetical protein